MKVLILSKIHSSCFKGVTENFITLLPISPYLSLQVEEPPPADKEAGKKQEGEQTNGPKLNEEQQQQQSPNTPPEPMDVD